MNKEIIESELLIKKQQKEIEELKEKNKTQSDCAESIERTEEMVNMRWVNHNYISKDKIRELLKHKGGNHFIAKVDIEELLEE